MQIGELSHLTGVSTKTIRYYEGIGVLPEPERADNGYRVYDQQMVDRLEFVKDAQATGLSLSEISYVLELRQQGVGTCRHIVDLVENHLADIDRQIVSLKSTRKRLHDLTQRAAALDPSDCTDPNRCQTIAPVDGEDRRSRSIHRPRGSQPHHH